MNDEHHFPDGQDYARPEGVRDGLTIHQQTIWSGFHNIEYDSRRVTRFRA
jgi:hypothetical protein